ncbi:CPBP family intramembrane glutamic endopeptidase [Janthinobacterium sp. Mn2066]|uniref:lysostaphin resistance A-like protein n=1 Tax=Janthinobacterium sp. Mn2066 TaxID=3395264 RepID=UPI003BC68921
MKTVPVTPLRATWLLIRLRLRRMLNAGGARFRFKRKQADVVSRPATAGKRRGTWLVSALVLASMLFSFGNIANQSVLNLHCALDAVGNCHGRDGMDIVAAQLTGTPFSTALLAGLSLQLCLLWLISVLLPLGTGELSRPDWDLEWLVTLPASKATLLWARVFERTIANPVGLVALLPPTAVIAWYGGYGWLAPLPALALSLLLLLAAAMLRTLVDTGLRLTLSPSSLGNLQAVISIVGVLPMYIAMSFGMGREGFALGWAAAMPAWSAWTPPGLVLQLLNRPTVPAAAALLLQVAVLLWLGMLILRRQLRDGVVGSGQRASVRTASKVAAPPSSRWRFGTVIQRRELSLLKRDRNFFVQTLLLPLVILGSQVIFTGRLQDVRELLDRPALLVSTGFFLGTYTLMMSAFQTLNKEGGSLWMLYTFPVSVEQALREKAQLWAVLSMLYPLILFGATLLLIPQWHWDLAGLMLLALAGIALYSVIAVALGVFASDPLAIEAQAKVRPTYLYLYMLLTGLYIGALSAGSLVQRLVFLVLTVALALALWQKARDQIPYLLDPAASPPARVSASDGLMAAMLFFVAQVLILLLLKNKESPSMLHIALAFGGAGGLTYVLVRLLYWRSKTTGVPRVLGGQQPLRRAGMAAGLAAICGIVYLYALQASGQLPAAPLLHAAGWNRDWLWLAGLTLLAAPLCEEFIFRGLIQGGLRRSLPAWQAITISAAIFAIVHPPASMLPVFVLGLCTGYAYQRSGSLLAPMLTHAGYNAAILLCQRFLFA